MQFPIPIYNKAMRSYQTFTARMLGLYAAILAFLHGVFEIQRGKITVNAISINAIGNGCVADQVWHACFPALTIWPTYFTAGVITSLVSIFLFLFVLIFLNIKNAGWIIIAFTIINLISGGGFISTFAAIMAAVAILLHHKPVLRSGKHSGIFKILCLFLLSIYIFYAAGGWLLGSYFNTFMVDNSFLIFFIMDILVPIMSIIFARIADTLISAEPSQFLH